MKVRFAKQQPGRNFTQTCTELCKIIPAKFGEFLPIFPKMAEGQDEAGLSSLAALRRENSNMQESFYTSLYISF